MPDIIDWKRHTAAALIALKELGMLKGIETHQAGTLIVDMGHYKKIVSPIMTDMTPEKHALRLMRAISAGHISCERDADALFDAYRGNAYCFETLHFAEDEILAVRDCEKWLKPLFDSIDTLTTPAEARAA